MKTLTQLLLSLLLAMPALAEDYIWAPNQPVGSQLPSFTLPDTQGSPQNINDLAGKNGTLLLFNRSTDW